MISLEPLQDRVLVKVRPLPEKTGSIHRVSVLRHEIAREADVIAVGPECRDVQPGQVVLLNSLAGQEVQDKLLVPESTILGFLEGDV